LLNYVCKLVSHQARVVRALAAPEPYVVLVGECSRPKRAGSFVRTAVAVDADVREVGAQCAFRRASHDGIERRSGSFCADCTRSGGAHLSATGYARFSFGLCRLFLCLPLHSRSNRVAIVILFALDGSYSRFLN
jgi:hypothetical protein